MMVVMKIFYDCTEEISCVSWGYLIGFLKKFDEFFEIFDRFPSDI